MIETWKHAINRTIVCCIYFVRLHHSVNASHFQFPYDGRPLRPTQTHIYSLRAVIQHKCKHLSDFQCNFIYYAYQSIYIVVLLGCIDHLEYVKFRQKKKFELKLRVDEKWCYIDGAMDFWIKMVNKVHYTLVGSFFLSFFYTWLICSYVWIIRLVWPKALADWTTFHSTWVIHIGDGPMSIFRYLITID